MTLVRKKVKGKERIYRERTCNDPKVGGYINFTLGEFTTFRQINEHSEELGGPSYVSYGGTILTSNGSSIFVDYSELRGTAGSNRADVSSGTSASIKYFENSRPQDSDLEEIAKLLGSCFERAEALSPLN